MSEYAHSKLSSKQPIQAETLFDDDTFVDVEHDVDTQGISYSEARMRRGIDAPHYKTPENPTIDVLPGVSVNLAARAIAISNIMNVYNKENRLIGASKASEFNARYRYPSAVLEQMSTKVSVLSEVSKKDFSLISATDELVKSGYPLQAARMHETAINQDLRNKYGPGQAHSGDRDKLMRKVNRTVRLVNKAV